VRPGDLISADGDGVLVIRPEDLGDAIVRAEARAAHEAEAALAIESGHTLFELHDLEAPLKASGVPVVDRGWRSAD
jgi:regulator of RNase E activity RraA